MDEDGFERLGTITDPRRSLWLNSNDILMQSVANFTYADDTNNQRKRDKIDRLEFFWVVIVIADLVIQSMPQYRSSPTQVLLYSE